MHLLYGPIILSATIKTFLVITCTNLLTNGICGNRLPMRQAQNKSAYKHKDQSLHNIPQKKLKIRIGGNNNPGFVHNQPSGGLAAKFLTTDQQLAYQKHNHLKYKLLS